VWVGTFSDPRRQAEAEQLAAQHEVRLTVKVAISDDELVDILCRAAAMIYAPVLEPFGLAPLEANACETPVVALAEGGVKETIEDGVNGRMVWSYGPEVLAEALSDVLDSPEYARRLGKQGRERVLDRWTLEAAGDELERQLLALVVDRPREPT
jgi:glycosyltransferase involved in cell wall biosynthesis